MKRYAIVEIPDRWFECGGGKTYAGSAVLHGPVELMEAACKEAGIVWRLPKKGDTYFSPEGRRQARIDFADMSAGGGYLQACIPAPEPEPEKPCPNCRNVKLWEDVEKYETFKNVFRCSLCGALDAEWTYAKEKWTAEWQVADPGGIGGGGTGGPI